MGDDMHRSKPIVRRSLLQVATLAGLSLAIATTAWAQAPQMPQQSGSQAAIAPGGAAPPQDPGYKLGPGDHLRINVFNQKDLTGEYLVDGTGLLAFPLIGQVQAGGLTAHELERAIINKLKPDYLRDPNVNVVVLTYRPFYIVGEVKQPGSYPYVSGMTVINAIALAGGFTYRAKESSFYLTRADKDGRKNRMDATPDTSVQPGDVITVRERYF
jgi:protein involved in polysaccharide export with SLBB domain